jgi:tetratricopeptide (TPR) repeat protein
MRVLPISLRVHKIAFAVTIPLLVLLAAPYGYADTTLPPSRYGSDLPTPSLLYPDANSSALFPHYVAAPSSTPLHPTLEQPLEETAPEVYEAVAVAPTMKPQIEAAADSAQPSRYPLPPPPSAQPAPQAATQPAAPRFEPINTIEKYQQQPLPSLEPIFMAEPNAEPTKKAAAFVELAPPVAAIDAPAPLVTASTRRAAVLDEQTRAALDRIPKGIDRPKATGRDAKLDRFSTEVSGILSPPAPEEGEEEVVQHESMGVAIAIRRPVMDVTTELQQAYESLMAGQPQIARSIYKDILAQHPNHQEALFGVATTFHRTGELELARPFYLTLLRVNPNHRDGIINFLSLVATEAPDEAIARLEYMESSNPDFSAIPALLGTLYDAAGKHDKAIASMARAVRQEPENLTYKYNLAVLLDKHDHAEEAIGLYNQLLAAGRSGLPLPAPMRDLQERIITLSNTARY